MFLKHCNKSTTEYSPRLSAVRFDGKEVCKGFHQTNVQSVKIGLENDQELHDTEVDYRSSVLKSLHAYWLISCYNHISSPEYKAIILSGWKKSGVLALSTWVLLVCRL